MTLPDITLPGDQSAAQELYVALRDAIFDGQLAPGQQLVEGAVAKVANVSRTPVREALHRLEMDGLITGRGTKTVAAPSRAELTDLVVVRENLEGLAAALAANARTDLDLEILRDAHQAYSRAAAAGNGDVATIVELNDRFHQAIRQTARNRYLTTQLGYLRKMVQRLQTSSTLSDPTRLAETVIEHELILGAITDRNVERAELVTRAHFRSAGARRIAHFDAAV